MDFPKNAPLVRVIQVSAGLTYEDGLWRYQQGDAHYNWLSNAIDDGRADGAQWIIVSSHLPCLSVGIYNCSNTDMFRLLAAKKVDLVLHGHEHAYMRTHQLTSGVPGCTTIPTGTFDADCVVDTDNSYAAGHGSVFATVGTGGIPLRAINGSDGEAGYFAASAGLGSGDAFGLLDINATDTQLTAQFVRTSGGNFNDSFTITKGAPPPNVPPTASMTTQVSGLTVTVDGSGSSDPDGTVVAHDWDFGDGATATGATPAPHPYATPGTYTVTLTVRDDDGETNTTTRSVTVSDAPPTIAEDTFTRTLASGWGPATTGGNWTVSTSSAFSVNGSVGSITSNAGNGRNAYLRSVSSNSSDMTVTFGINKVTTGSGFYASLVGRSIIGSGDYRSGLRYHPDGRLSLRIGRTSASGSETFIVPETVVPGVTYAAGDRVHVRQQVTGTSPTTIRVRMWKVGTTEPATWHLTTTDNTANLQGNGSIGLVTYLSSGATNPPIVFTVDDLLVTP
jgi:PKD repeat protein